MFMHRTMSRITQMYKHMFDETEDSIEYSI